MYLDRRKLLEKLDEISQLYDLKLRLERKMRNFQPEDNYERTIVIPQFPGEYANESERKVLFNSVQHSKDNAVKLMQASYRKIYEPKAPAEPDIKPFADPGPTSDEKEQSSKLGCLGAVGLVGGILFTFGFFMNLSTHFPAFALVVAIGCIATFLVSRAKKKQINMIQKMRTAQMMEQYKQQSAATLAEYQTVKAAYEKAFSDYTAKSTAFFEEYATWREIYLQVQNEETQIAEKLAEDRKAGIQKIYEEEYLPVEYALNRCNDLLSEDYLPAIDDIADLIRGGRADDLKEAINLYEDIQYRERQLQLEREKEQQRRYEEQQRRNAEERRHQEQMAFQQQQEQQRQREEEQRQKDAERRHKEDMAQREKMEQDRQRQAEQDRRQAQRAEMDRKSKEDAATLRQCNTCALNSHCSVAFTRPNCASFRPR